MVSWVKMFPRVGLTQHVILADSRRFYFLSLPFLPFFFKLRISLLSPL